MLELYEMLLQLCFNEEVLSLEAACVGLGLNIEKILEYSATDQDAQSILKMICSTLKSHVHEQFFKGNISRVEAGDLIADLDDIIEIYLSMPIQPPTEE